MKKTILIIILIIIVIGTYLLLDNKQKPINNEPIKIGALLSLTGDASAWGENAQKGIALATEEINKNGGINGRNIEIIYEDTAGDPKQAVSAFQRVISVENVMAIIGPLNQTEDGAVMPLIEQTKTPSIIPGFFPIKNRKNLSNPIFIWTDAESEAGSLAEYLFYNGVRKIGVMGTVDAWEETVTRAFTEKFESIGGVVTALEIIQPSASDAKLPITKILATKPEAIYLGTYYQFINATKEIHNLGFKGSVYSIEVDDYLAGETSKWSNNLRFIAPDYYSDEFINTFTNKYGVAPGLPAGQSYDSANVLFSFLKKSTDKNTILELMKKFNQYDGVSGQLTISSDGRTHLPVAIFEIKDGKINKTKLLE